MGSGQDSLKLFIVLLLTVIGWLLFSSVQADVYVHPLTGRRDSVPFSIEEQIQMGQEIAPEIEAKLGGLWLNAPAWDRIHRIGIRIVQALHRLEWEKQRPGVVLNWGRFQYEFKVVRSLEVNAAALPGGIIYIYKGLLNIPLSDDQLAAVLSHEISHVVLRHAAKAFVPIQSSYHILKIIEKILGQQQKPILDIAWGVRKILELRYSREQETEADHFGYILSCYAGYDPRGAIEFLELLGSSTDPEYLQDHPMPQSRINYLRHLTCALPAW